MNNDNLSLIDPAFENIEQVCRAQISEYLDSLPLEEKIDMGLASLTPQIPGSQEEVQKYIDACVDLYEANTQKEQEGLKSELIDTCSSLGIVVDTSLPLAQFQSAMRSTLQGRSNHQLLVAGVFGHQLTQEEVDQNKTMIISGYLVSIKQAAADQALIELKRIDLVNTEFNYSFIADKFPLLVSRVKENILRRNLLN